MLHKRSEIDVHAHVRCLPSLISLCPQSTLQVKQIRHQDIVQMLKRDVSLKAEGTLTEDISSI